MNLINGKLFINPELKSSSKNNFNMIYRNGKNITKFPLFILVLISSLFLSSCSKEKPLSKSQIDSIKTAIKDSIKAETIKDTILQYKPGREIRYSILKIKGRKTVHALDSLYKKRGREVILALNRLDTKNLRWGDSLVIPDTIMPLISYSPFPFVIEEARSVKKLLMLSRLIQAFAAYENGVLIKWGPTSTGRKSKQTPAGLFGLNWKKEKTTSTIDPTWILPFYFNFDNFEGAAFHQYDMPGYPASHACVRLLEQDAKWIYYWGQQWIVSNDGENIVAFGTPVIVFDDYNFGKTPPWKFLPQKPDTIIITDKQIDKLMKKNLQTILERQKKRIEVVAEREKKLNQNKG